ncbi:MAG: 16S rRNA (adenine(1518)-N(6)/adenine(1519)-N(6))-dimethyltransferase RsmA [Gammaproteobacteria bacterium]|nr:16S rRNA (adenine(1518)-N(6)/adenine(1519)-N(6))-dimethyltransferase RsmA [Gammaproteobacteria bacterium]
MTPLIRPKKKFGQHFLRDGNIIDRIVLVISPQHDDHMVEIGPGQGALTQAVLEKIDQLSVIEIDHTLIPILQQLSAEKGRLHIHHADALKFDFNSLTSEKKLRVIGNLPYNISTPLLFHLFSAIDIIQDMHFMLQKEVVDRLVAPVGGHHYSRLSVMTQYFCHSEKLFTVSPNAFYPPPKVHSAVVRLTPYQSPPFKAKDIQLLKKVVSTAFQQRRKTLRNSLKGIIDHDGLAQLNIDSQLRAERITLEQYVAISNTLIL